MARRLAVVMLLGAVALSAGCRTSHWVVVENQGRDSITLTLKGDRNFVVPGDESIGVEVHNWLTEPVIVKMQDGTTLEYRLSRNSWSEANWRLIIPRIRSARPAVTSHPVGP